MAEEYGSITEAAILNFRSTCSDSLDVYITKNSSYRPSQTTKLQGKKNNTERIKINSINFKNDLATEYLNKITKDEEDGEQYKLFL